MRRSFRGLEVKSREEATDFAYVSFKAGEEDGRQRVRREQLYFDYVSLGVER